MTGFTKRISQGIRGIVDDIITSVRTDLEASKFTDAVMSNIVNMHRTAYNIINASLRSHNDPHGDNREVVTLQEDSLSELNTCATLCAGVYRDNDGRYGVSIQMDENGVQTIYVTCAGTRISYINLLLKDILDDLNIICGIAPRGVYNVALALIECLKTIENTAVDNLEQGLSTALNQACHGMDVNKVVEQFQQFCATNYSDPAAQIIVRNIICTGHSLGGVCADILMALLRNNDINAQSIVFESPGSKRVLNSLGLDAIDYAEYSTAVKTNTKMVNSCDAQIGNTLYLNTPASDFFDPKKAQFDNHDMGTIARLINDVAVGIRSLFINNSAKGVDIVVAEHERSVLLANFFGYKNTEQITSQLLRSIIADSIAEALEALKTLGSQEIASAQKMLIEALSVCYKVGAIAAITMTIASVNQGNVYYNATNYTQETQMLQRQDALDVITHLFDIPVIGTEEERSQQIVSA